MSGTVFDASHPSVRVNPVTFCWEWMASRTTRGYGIVWIKQGLQQKPRQRAAHRVFFAAAGNALSRAQHLHHMCKNPCCVNPAHCAPMTASEHKLWHNANDGIKGYCERHVKKMACPKCGGGYTTRRVVIEGKARAMRFCAACRMAYSAQQRSDPAYKENQKYAKRFWYQKKRQDKEWVARQKEKKREWMRRSRTNKETAA